MKHKKFNLFLVSVLTVILFFTIPSYNRWLYGKILASNVFREMKHLGVEERKEYKYGNAYVIYRSMAATLRPINAPVVLMPPKGYLEARHILFTPAIPAEFYYYTGIHSVGARSPYAETARWQLVFKKGDRMSITKIHDRHALESLIALYQQYN